MKVVIYGDVVFLINFIMDFFILAILGRLVKKRAGLWRLLLGSLIMAALYCLIMFIIPFHAYINIFAAEVIIMLGITAAYRPRKVKEFLKMLFLAHITAFSLGGLTMGLYYFTNISQVMSNALSFGLRHFSLKVLLASSCLFYILVKLGVNFYKSRIVKKQICYSVTIYLENTGIGMNALLDTGNSLRDPLTNAPVIIAEYSAIKDFLPENIDIGGSDVEADFGSISHRLRIIPYSSVGKQNGMLLGFKPDKVIIEDGSKTTILENVVIGVYNFKLSSDGAYQGLLNPEILENNYTGGN